jgi:hypothetical protein
VTFQLSAPKSTHVGTAISGIAGNVKITKLLGQSMVEEYTAQLWHFRLPYEMELMKLFSADRKPSSFSFMMNSDKILLVKRRLLNFTSALLRTPYSLTRIAAMRLLSISSRDSLLMHLW